MPKVSVVIPVYNVEQYIERCLYTLFNQTLNDIEYIFVDDCSPDKSVEMIYEILENYLYRKNQVKVLHHQKNNGVAAARTTGILAATGDYIIHCDPDDYVELTIYEKMYKYAIDKNADIVTCYYWIESPNKINKIRNDYYQTPQESLMHLFNGCDVVLWDKLVKRSIISQYSIIPYPDIDYCEDLGCTVRILHYAQSIYTIKEPLYHHYRRCDSITTALNKYHVDSRERCVLKLCDFLETLNKHKYNLICNRLKFYLKMEYNRVCRINDRDWFNKYRESHRSILSFDYMPLKSRIVLWFVFQNYYIYKILRKYISGL